MHVAAFYAMVSLSLEERRVFRGSVLFSASSCNAMACKEMWAKISQYLHALSKGCTSDVHFFK